MYEQWVIEAEKLLKEGKTFTEIGKLLKKNRQTVSKHLKAKAQGIAIINHNDMNKNMNHRIFQTIDTEEKAYWLGMMYADGYIETRGNAISLALKEEDLYHIESFKKFLGVNNKIQKKVKDNTYVSYNLSFKSKQVKDDLIANGCFENKSKILQFPTEDIVPQHLIHHFIRGYVDGDGCITTSNNGKQVSVEILGSENFLNGLIEINLFNRNHLYSFKHSDIKRVSYSGEKAMMVLNYLYEDATIYLKRKAQRYRKWLLPS